MKLTVQRTATSLLEYLTRPSSQLKQPEQRQQARLLSALAVILLFIIPITSPIWLQYVQDSVIQQFVSVGILLIFSVTYGLSHTRYYQIGAMLLIFSILALVVFIMHAAPSPVIERMPALNFMIVAILIASLMLPRQVTLLVATLSLSIIGTLFFVPEAPFSSTYAYLVLFVLLIILGAVGDSFSQRYKQQLLESEERYRSVVAALSEGIVLQTRDGAIQACNKAAEQILGQNACQMLGRTSVDPHWRAIHEDGSPFPGESHPAMVTLLTGEPLSEVVMGVHQPDGQRRWISINSQPLLRLGDALPYAVVTSFFDITTRKQQERALRETQLRYYRLFEQGHDAVFILDLTGRHLEANHRAAEMLGYSVAEIQTLTLRDLSAEVSQSSYVLSRLLEGEHVPVYERVFRRKDGSLIPVEINAELVRDLDGNPLHIQSVVRDISERKQAQQREFDLALEKERLQLLTIFVQNAAHEFRTPLSVINTAAFVMARLPEADKRQAKVEIIQRQVQRMVRLIDMLLLMTRLENHAVANQLMVDMGGLVETMCQNMITEYGSHPALQYERKSQALHMLGDPEELAEAVRQILDNAYRFTPADGIITVSAGVDDDYLWLTVCDSGPGIAPEHLPHIFKTFWRQDEAHTMSGFGLGLPIAQKIVERNGGRIEVASEVGVGATFRIIFPVGKWGSERP